MRPSPTRTCALLCLLALTGCGGGSDDEPTATALPTTGPAPAPPSSVPPSAVPPSSVAPAPPGPAASTPAPGPSAAAPVATGCAPSRLAVTLRPDAGGALGAPGSYSVVVVNSGTAACALEGHPGVSYVVGGSTPVGAAAAREGVAAPVTLAPGGSAVAALRIADPQGVDRQVCQSSPVDGLRVTPPGSTTATVVPAPGSTCADPAVVLLTVGPLRAG